MNMDRTLAFNAALGYIERNTPSLVYAEIVAELCALNAENGKLRVDADRYRWIVDNCGFGTKLNGATELNCFFYDVCPDNMGDLDAAISAAMKDTK
jgi:hypothetical protein